MYIAAPYFFKLSRIVETERRRAPVDRILAAIWVSRAKSLKSCKHGEKEIRARSNVLLLLCMQNCLASLADICAANVTTIHCNRQPW